MDKGYKVIAIVFFLISILGLVLSISIVRENYSSDVWFTIHSDTDQMWYASMIIIFLTVLSIAPIVFVGISLIKNIGSNRAFLLALLTVFIPRFLGAIMIWTFIRNGSAFNDGMIDSTIRVLERLTVNTNIINAEIEYYSGAQLALTILTIELIPVSLVIIGMTLSVSDKVNFIITSIVGIVFVLILGYSVMLNNYNDYFDGKGLFALLSLSFLVLSYAFHSLYLQKIEYKYYKN